MEIIRRIGPIGLIAVAAVAATALLLAPTPASALSLRNASNNLGLVGYWTLNDGTSTKATDFSGNGNTGTLTNMEAADWVAGKKGKALDLGGTDEHVALPADLFETDNTGTISAWIKPSALSGTVFSSYLSSPSSYMRLYTTSTNLAVQFFQSGTYNNALSGNTTLTINTWYHVAVTTNGSAWSLYVNGVLQSLSVVAGSNTGQWFNDFTAGANTVHIGQRGDSAAYFTGIIDDVRIYNRALSATEIANMYNDGQATIKAKDNTGLVGYWNFDEGVGRQATDFSGKGNIGTRSTAGNFTWTQGKRGKSIDFVSQYDTVYLTLNRGLPIYSTSTPYSISAWVKSAPAGARATKYVYYEYPSSGNAWFALRFGSTGKLSAITVNNSGGVAYSKTSTSVIADNTWHHFLFEDSAGSAKMFIDGVQDATDFSYTPSSITNVAPFTNASISAYLGYNFSGIMDDFRIYNRALSAQQVADLYNAGATTASPTIKTVSRQGLVGYWSLDDGVGTLATDFSGRGFTGTLLPATTTPTWVTGKRGKGLQLSTTDYDQKRYVEATNTTNTSLNASGTVALWFKGTNIETANEALFSKGNDVSGLNGVLFSVRTNQGLAWYFGSASATQSKQGIGTIVNGIWYHAVFTWDGSNIKTYLNGSLADSTAQTVIPVTTAYPIIIGNNAIINRNFVGTVDEVRVYNRALSATEILTLYNIGR